VGGHDEKNQQEGAIGSLNEGRGKKGKGPGSPFKRGDSLDSVRNGGHGGRTCLWSKKIGAFPGEGGGLEDILNKSVKARSVWGVLRGHSPRGQRVLVFLN